MLELEKKVQASGYIDVEGETHILNGLICVIRFLISRCRHLTSRQKVQMPRNIMIMTEIN